MSDIALFDLMLGPEALERCRAWLDPAERAHAERFCYRRDRDRFIARRGRLRARLAEEVGGSPGDVRIEADAFGKPFLPDYPELRFNLSHSRDLALCVIARGAEVGCDIEWRNPELACPAVARRLFAPAEWAALEALPEAQWVEGFFNCWTRKEAYVKALGLGLSYPLDAFTVSVGESATLVEAMSGWSLISFEPAPGYQAALVTGSPCIRPSASATASCSIGRANRPIHAE
jgi:4'-phosphopantetheinyl transferase